MRAGVVLVALSLLVTASACGVEGSSKAEPNAPKPRCPAAWRAGWQRLANRVGTTVSKDHSYLAGFIWFEHGSGEVHVNLRGYPHRTSIPLCRNDEQAGPKRVKTLVPCFSDRKWTKHVGGFKVTLYTVNRDADQWHLLYAWRHAGSLYAISEHVAPPFGYARVLQNLDRMTRNLVPVAPAG